MDRDHFMQRRRTIINKISNNSIRRGLRSCLRKRWRTFPAITLEGDKSKSVCLFNKAILTLRIVGHWQQKYFRDSRTNKYSSYVRPITIYLMLKLVFRLCFPVCQSRTV